MPAIVSLAAVVVDCRQAVPLAAFYQAAFGGEIVRSGEGSAWLRAGAVTVITWTCGLMTWNRPRSSCTGSAR